MRSLIKFQIVKNLSIFQTIKRNILITNILSQNATDNEKKISSILKEKFSTAKFIQVQDMSGGCGAMYDVTVISPEFEGISIVKQHRMVTEALKNEIKQMHGLRISTDHNIEK